jgi:hypothetical protein
MGNIECCVQKSPYDEIDSKEEIYIREILHLYYKKMVSNDKLYKLMKKYFSIYLLDIDGLPLEWVEEKNYNSFISDIFDTEVNNNILSYLKLDYNSIKNISVKDYFDKFHLLLCIWLVGISPSKTLNSEQKIEIIKNIIIKCNKYITFKTFSKFINIYLEIMLIEMTYNFRKHNLSETKILLNDIYNNFNVSEYCKWLCWKMGKIVLNIKKIDKMDQRAVNNEFIKDEHLDIFFRKYSFLLWPLELRNNFFNKYK